MFCSGLFRHHFGKKRTTGTPGRVMCRLQNDKIRFARQTLHQVSLEFLTFDSLQPRTNGLQPNSNGLLQKTNALTMNQCVDSMTAGAGDRRSRGSALSEGSLGGKKFMQTESGLYGKHREAAFLEAGQCCFLTEDTTFNAPHSVHPWGRGLCSGGR